MMHLTGLEPMREREHAAVDATATTAPAASLRELLRHDVEALRRRGQGQWAHLVFPNFFVVACYRVANHVRRRGHRKIARVIAVLGQTLTGAEISPAAVLGPGMSIVHTHGVIIGPGVIAGRNLVVFGGVTLGARTETGYPIIEDDVRVMANASVLGPVLVGRGGTVGAHALALHDVPPGEVVLGVPARPVATRVA
jgi:serine O-acetyltransferase